MNLDLKFGINDAAFFVEGARIYQTTIHRASVSIDYNGNVKETYRTVGTALITARQLPAEQLFRSKEELIAALQADAN